MAAINFSPLQSSLLGSLYDITRFPTSKQHLSLDKMQMKDIKAHMTQKTHCGYLISLDLAKSPLCEIHLSP